MTTLAMTSLERIAVAVPEAGVEAFTAALESACLAVGLFHDEDTGIWTIEGVRVPGDFAPLEAALALAAMAAGLAPPAVVREAVPAEGWLAQVAQNFPPQPIGKTWLVVGTHDAAVPAKGRRRIVLDAGLAFGSGEHGSTRGCLRAIEALRRPRGRVIDVGTGSGILAIAAAMRWQRPVLATDIDPVSVAVAAENARDNKVGHKVRTARADGWNANVIRAGRPYALVLANILARPLCAMARDLARCLAPGGHVVLAGLLDSQANAVRMAHRRGGLVLARRLQEGRWTTLVLRKPGRAQTKGAVPKHRPFMAG